VELVVGVTVGLLLLDERKVLTGFGFKEETFDGLILGRSVAILVVAMLSSVEVGFKVVLLLDSTLKVVEFDGRVPLQQTSDFPQGLPYSFNCTKQLYS